MEKYVITGYLIYLPVALLMTFLVARVLFKSSKVFMLDIFHGRKEIAFSTNRLFEIGFYLLNIGVALMILEMAMVGGYREMIEDLSVKIGGFSFWLGLMLFVNLFLLFRGKRKSRERAYPDAAIGAE